jgi:hypothetical protein
MEAYVGLDVHSKRRVFVIEAADGRVAHAATSRPRAARADMRIPSTTLSATTSVPGLQTAPPSSTPLPLRNVTPTLAGISPPRPDRRRARGRARRARRCAGGARMTVVPVPAPTSSRSSVTSRSPVSPASSSAAPVKPGVLIGRARQLISASQHDHHVRPAAGRTGIDRRVAIGGEDRLAQRAVTLGREAVGRGWRASAITRGPESARRSGTPSAVALGAGLPHGGPSTFACAGPGATTPLCSVTDAAVHRTCRAPGKRLL